MSSSSPLTGSVLVDCAKANAVDGAAVAAERCGYGDDVQAFQAALKSACKDMGIEIEDVSDLITEQQRVKTSGGTEIAPDTPSDL